MPLDHGQFQSLAERRLAAVPSGNRSPLMGSEPGLHVRGFQIGGNPIPERILNDQQLLFECPMTLGTASSVPLDCRVNDAGNGLAFELHPRGQFGTGPEFALPLLVQGNGVRLAANLLRFDLAFCWIPDPPDTGARVFFLHPSVLLFSVACHVNSSRYRRYTRNDTRSGTAITRATRG
jgi:hypothetical protein